MRKEIMRHFCQVPCNPLACDWCGKIICIEEYVTGFGVCNGCMEKSLEEYHRGAA